MKFYGTFRIAVRIGTEHAAQNVIMHIATDNITSTFFLIIGRIAMGSGNHDANITVWMKCGQDNEMIVFCDNTTLQDATVDYYKAVYP
jgi:hypothetical protein